MWGLVKHDQLFLRAKKTQALVGELATDTWTDLPPLRRMVREGFYFSMITINLYAFFPVNAIPKLSIGSQTGSGKKLRNFCTCALTISLLLNAFIVIFFALPGRYWRIDCSVKE